jgi:hypothetical protein
MRKITILRCIFAVCGLVARCISRTGEEGAKEVQVGGDEGLPFLERSLDSIFLRWMDGPEVRCVWWYEGQVVAVS